MADKILKSIRLIEKQVREFSLPALNRVSQKKDPYLILISCILSLRTKDKTTDAASRRLFKVAANPVDMIKLSPGRIASLIYPVGFYRNKSRVILDISARLIRDFRGRVPARLEELLRFKGVGRKTANLVLGLGFGIPAICVDTHVHRISNRIGWVDTTEPRQTEEMLEGIIPGRLWIKLNTLLVAFGQNICLPVSPYCSRCLLFKSCRRRGVAKSR